MFNNKSNDNMPKKHFVNVIKNNGSPSSLIYKYYVEDFNNNSTLIVDEGQEAIFLKDGVVEGILPPGSHILNTSNYPFLTRIKTLVSGGESKYNCRIYFVKKNITKEYNWGTAEAIQVRDPVEGILTKVRANGAYVLQISDSKQFFTKLSGTLYQSFDEYNVMAHIKEQIQSVIIKCISNYIKNSHEEIIGIVTNKEKIAESIKHEAKSIFEEYGLIMKIFVIKNIIVDEDENRRALEQSIARQKVEEREYNIKQMEAAGTAAARKIEASGNAEARKIEASAEADAQKIRSNAQREIAEILGMSVKEKMQYELLETFAQNSNGAPTAAAVITGLETGQGVAGMMNDFFSKTEGNEKENVEKTEDVSDFVQMNGKEDKISTDVFSEMNQLKDMLETGQITKEDYELKRSEILKKYGL